MSPSLSIRSILSVRSCKAREAEFRRGARWGCKSASFKVGTAREIGAAFATFSDVRGRGRAFRQPLGPILRRPPRATRHTGRHAMQFPRSFSVRELPEAGALMSYGTNAVGMPTVRSASMSAASSRARNRRTCRSCSQPSMRRSSTSRPPRRWASKFRSPCSRTPMR